MAELNKLLCATDEKNVGFGSCFLDFKKIVGAIGIPKGRILTKAELADLQATLLAGVTAAKSLRFIPIHKFVGVTDNSEDPVFATLQYGTNEPVRRGNYRWLFNYREGGLCLSNALQSFKASSKDWLFYDDENKLIGTRKKDNTGAYGLAGVPMDVFFAYDWKLNDGANPTQYRVLFDFNPKWTNTQVGYVVADFPIEDIKGLQNINLEQVGASAAGVIELKALTGCDGTDLYELYAAELAAAGLWTATNAVTGAAITITSVAGDANDKSFVITLSAADPDYPVAAGDKVIINTAAASVLAAANVVGFEGIAITVNRG